MATSWPASAARTAWTAPASGRRSGAVEDEHGERREPVEGRVLAGLGGDEVAPFLARQAGHHDPADAHRPRPGERLRIDPRADHEDRAGRPDVEPARSQLALGTGLEPSARRRTEGHDPADAAPGRPDRDPDAGSDLADDARRTAIRACRTGRPARRASGRATGRRTRHPDPASSPRRGGSIQRSPGRGATSGGSSSSRRGSRMRSAIGAPTTTESPADTSGRSPGARANTASTGATTRRRAGTRRTSEAVTPPSRSRPTSATTRAARRAGRPGPAAAAARRAGRRRGRRDRPSRRSRNAGRACRA